MATVEMQVVEACEAYQRTLAVISPRVFFVIRGKHKGSGVIQTWRSQGQPDLRSDSHEDVVVIDQVYRE